MLRRFRKRDANPERLRLEECNTAGSSISHSALFNQFPGTAQGRIGDLFTAHQAGYLLNVLFTCQGQDSGGCSGVLLIFLNSVVLVGLTCDLWLMSNGDDLARSEEHTSELQSRGHL